MKKKIYVLCFVFAFIVLNSYSCQNTINCTEEYRAGLVVTVKDSVTNAVLSSGVTVLATENNWVDTLRIFDENYPFFTGVFERKGIYVITVYKDNYKTYQSQTVTILADECHVITQNIEVFLIPIN